MTILVLGAAGMLGHKMLQVLAARFPGTLGTIRGTLTAPENRRLSLLSGAKIIEGFDAASDESSALLRSLRPDVIVNCIGLVKQRAESKAAIPSIIINALLPHRLVELSAAWGGRVIHFSTDCVFSGTRGAYTEEDHCDADDLYGRTKHLGEISGPRAVTLRTSMIGRELSRHQSLLDWFLSNRSASIRGYTRAIFSGVTTRHLAALVSDIIAHHRQLCGLYHVASEPLSKYDLLCRLRDVFDVPVEIVPDNSFACDRSLRGDLIKQAIGYSSPSWHQLLAELAEDPTPYSDWRTNA